MEQNDVKSLLPFISKGQVSALVELFNEEPRPAKVMPHEVCNKLGIDLKIAMAIFTILHEAEVIICKQLIYHNCSSRPVDAMPFLQGFPALPWKCPHCGKRVRSYKNLKFGYMASVKQNRKISAAS